MADLVSTDVKVTQGPKDESPGLCQNGDSLMRPSVAFGDSALTYPTYGIPVPDIAQFRLKFGITRIQAYPRVFTHYWFYDKTVRANAPYGTLRAYAMADGAEMSGAVSPTVLDLDVWGA
jgi:hypothetical protein